MVGCNLDINADTEFLDRVWKNGVEAMTESSLRVAFFNESIESAAKSAVANTVGKSVFQETAVHIGRAYNGENPIGYFEHKGLHFLSGAAVGAFKGLVTSEDILKSALASGAGAVLSEMIVETQQDAILERSADRVASLQKQGQEVTEQEIKRIIRDETFVTVELTKLGVGLSAHFAGLDPNIAQGAAANAMENNFIPGIIAVAMMPEVLAWLFGGAATILCVNQMMRNRDESSGLRLLVEGHDGQYREAETKAEPAEMHDGPEDWSDAFYVAGDTVEMTPINPDEPSVLWTPIADNKALQVLVTPVFDGAGPQILLTPVDNNGHHILYTPINPPLGPNVNWTPIHDGVGMSVLMRGNLPDNMPDNTWIPPEEALDKVPDFLGEGQHNKKRNGFRWLTKHGANQVRIDKGNPTADHPHEQVDHVRINKDGKMMDWEGNLLPAGTTNNIPEVHIPLSDWLKWKSWDKKE